MNSPICEGGVEPQIEMIGDSTLSKRRSKIWDDQTLTFRAVTAEPADYSGEMLMEPETQVSPEYLEDAHEALSKLLNKTNKRTKQMRGVRRKDAWQ